MGSEPSTHILKPNHLGDDYPASVINEYFVMSLARSLGLPVPPVFRRYTPEPVYIVERFDRLVDSTGRTQRRHIIDACQLLNKSRAFKYKTATLQALAQIVGYCRNRVLTRLSLYRWLVFNLLLANTDNHLKNLSFMVSAAGIELAPAYDLLSTGADLLVALNALEQRIERENADYPEPVRVFLGGERRLVSTIKHVIVRDMLQRLSAVH